MYLSGRINNVIDYVSINGAQYCQSSTRAVVATATAAEMGECDLFYTKEVISWIDCNNAESVTICALAGGLN